MNHPAVPYFRRLGIVAASLLVAALLVWRGNTYPDPAGGMTVPVMCVSSALFVFFAGLSLCFRDDDGGEPSWGE